MYVVEWQKRGLPHVHMLIWLDGASKTYLNRNVDKFVSVEIPNPEQDPAGYAAVKLFMIHGPCGLQRSKSPCMKNKRCIRHFPKRYCARTMFDQSGFPLYKRRKTGHTVRVRKAELDNQWVVPYNRELLLRYQCHINVEICNRARCMKYLFKYCLKGSDRATVEIKSKNKTAVAEGDDRQIDEINRFFDGRYVCGAEACHRIFAFDIHHRTIGVERLPFHLEGKKSITYRKEEQAKKVVEKEKYRQSKLEAFFKLCNEKVEARQYTYEEIPRYYVWKKALTKWDLRKQGVQIGRISYTHHSTGELWYMRLLLLKVRGPTSFADLRTVDGKVYNTYQEACGALGLLDDDKEWDAALKECSNSGMPAQIRNLFVQIIVNNRITDIKKLWSNHWQSMSDDVLNTQKELSGFHDLQLQPQEIQYYALAEIDKVLRSIGKSITDFKQLPQPPISYLETSRQNLVFEETAYDTTEMTAQHNDMRLKLNRQQEEVYNAVLQSVYGRKGGMFFVYGSGGCGKTFLWRTIITRLRSESRIVLPVASSGIAATLLMGGRTAHSRFKIPIVLDELSTCSISHKSDIAELLKKTDLIIWDEAPMQHRYAFEALDRTLRDIMKSVNLCRAEIPFGGITVLLGGDFRQILLVVSMGSRSDIVSSCITRSRLWDGCKIFTLKQNMRLNKGCTNEESQCIKKFGEWILDIGDGKGGEQKSNDEETSDRIVTIPPYLCIDADSADIHILIDRTFPELRIKYNDVKYLSERAILTPTNEIVSHLNDLILDIIPGQLFTYYIADKAEFIGGYNHEIDQAYPTEILNSLRFPGLPAHELKLKPGTLVMLMRNLNQTLGLCNGTRMIVTQCMKNVVECEVIAGANIGCKHFIPKMELSPSESRLPFLLVRRQFPLQICYAMTINKSQGQSLEVVGLYLPTDVFTHGQLYVALSRVTSPQGLHIFIDNEHGKTTNLTKNVVYDEVFYNLPKST